MQATLDKHIFGLKAKLFWFFIMTISCSASINAQYTTVGDATVSGPDCVQLTTANMSQAGCAWHGIQLDFNQNFTQEFTMNFGNLSGNNGGADGITIIYEPNGGMPCGTGGGDIAYNGIADSWVVEFDTWDNGWIGEIPNDHVAIHANGSNMNLVAGPVSLGELENDIDRTIGIEWDACTMTFEVYVDGVLMISEVNDIVANFFGGQNIVNWGHSSSCGFAFNAHAVCLDDIQQTNVSTPTTIFEGPFTICEGDTYEIGGNLESDPGEYLDETILCVSETYVQLNVLDIVLQPAPTIDCNSDFPCLNLGSMAFVTNYDLSIDNNVTYAWTTNDGTIQSDADTPTPTICTAGTYEVTFSANGVSCTETIEVFDNGAPPEEPVFSGETLICLPDNNTYFATYEAPMLGGIVDYVWTYPNNAFPLNGDDTSPTIDLEFTAAEEGEVCLFITNNCGANNSYCLQISIQETPQIPEILGNVEVCQGIETYIATNAPEGISTDVVWSVPLDATILGNPFDISIDIDWTGSAGGEVCAFFDNDCGTVQECIEVMITSPETCDDGDCTNGIEAWNAMICECETAPAILGCTNINAANYNNLATCDDGSCILDCIELGPPIDVCGYEYTLSGITPTTGMWTNLCNLSDGIASFTTLPDDTFLFEVNNCGTYYFEYSVNDATCVDSDTLVMNFENNNVGVVNLSPTIEIDYSSSVCHVGGEGSTGCVDGNIITLDPVPDLEVEWDMCASGSCNSANVVTQTFGENGCEATAIDISSDTNQGAIPITCATFSQEDFVVNGVVDIDELVNLLDFDLALIFLQLQCPLTAPCFEVPDSCTITEIQNFTIDLPIRGKGFWTYNNQPLTDNSIITVNGQDYQLAIDLNACHYGPEPLTFTLLEMIAGVPSQLTSDVTVTLQWQENWTIETVVIPLEVPVSNPNCDLCNTGYDLVIDPIASPTQPDYSCQPIDLIFHVPVPLNCDDNDCSTSDFYNASTCECEYTPVPPLNCDDNDCSTTDFYNVFTCECEYTPVPPLNCDDNDCSTTDSYNPSTCECEYTTVPPLNCDDNDCSTSDFYNASTCECEYTAVPPLNCDDNVCSTTDFYNASTCECEYTQLPPLNCNDNDCNTTDFYNPATCACEYTQIPPPNCDDNDCTTADFYDDVDCECVNVPDPPPNCDDNDCNTIDTYNILTCECEYQNITPPNCDDANCNTIDTYNDQNCQCEYTQIPPPNCDDNCPNTSDSFNAATCECENILTPPNCDDACQYTIDTYNESTCQCENILNQPDCNDNCPDTNDSYNEATCSCENILVPPNCDDNDCLTADNYNVATCSCEYSPITPGACDDNCQYTIDTYDVILCQCVFTLVVPDCDDNCPNTVDSYNEATCSCENILVPPNCDDNCPNTADSYNVLNCECENILTAPNCDDNCVYTTDLYDEVLCDCVYTLTPPNCDDNCPNTTDIFNETTCECENNLVIPDCDDNCDNTADTYNEVTCECENILTVPDCDDSCPNTIDTYNTVTCECENDLVIPDCNDNCEYTEDNYNAITCECENVLTVPTCDDGICENGFETWNEVQCECEVAPAILGCTDPNEPNYDPLANCDDGSCGCIDPNPPTGIQPVTYCFDDFVPPLLADDPGVGFEIVWLDEFGVELGIGVVFNPPFNGIYNVQVRDIATGCTSTSVATSVSEIALPLTLILQDSATLDCISATYTIDGSGSSTGSEYEYQWAGPDDEAFSNNPTVIISLSGTYTLTVMDIVNGCSTSDSIVITENVDYPELMIAETENLDCDTDEVLLSGAGSQQSASIFNYWIAPNGVDTISFDITATATQPGIYTFYGFDSFNNCLNDLTIEVQGDFVAPLADAGDDVYLDCDQSLQTIGSQNTSSGNTITLDWSTNNSEVVLPLNPPLLLDVNMPGEYTLTVSDDSNGCFSTDIVNVFESENNIEITDLAIINPDCFGETGAIFLNAPVGGTPPYLYAIDGSPFSTSAAFVDLPAGNYNVAILDAEGCEFETNVIVEAPDQLVVDLGDDLFIDLGDSVSLTALINQQIDSIIWISVDTLSCDSCLTTSITPQLTTNIQVVVYDENGCIQTDDINIIVNKERNIFIPNSFTPNNDGLNDILNIFAGQDVEIINSFTIFDRWGEQVFAINDFLPNDPTYGWDGNLNGQPMDPAVFVYYAEITFVDGVTEVFQGDFALLR